MKSFTLKMPVLGVIYGNRDFFPDQLDTFGNRAVAKIPRLQKLMHHVCKNGFEHHVVMTQSKSPEF